jgi:tetratricopeptide (TPR) repeat protein
MFQTKQERSMSLRSLLPLLALLAILGSPVWALDSIKTSKALISGSILEMGKYTVKLKRTGDREETVQVNEIEFIRFDGEPAQLNLIRSAVNAGRYKDALEGLDKINAENLKAEIKQEMEFFRAFCKARQALAGEGTVADAGKLMNAFVQANPNNWRYLEACEVLGDLFVAINNFPLAQQKYGELEQAPWTNVKMRGGVLKGRALQGEGKFDEAAAAFDNVLKLGASESGDLVQAQKQAATIGKAGCLAQTGKSAEAVGLLEQVIDKADPEQAELHALAYNALGASYRKAGNTKSALLAYLHVDVLYNSYAHAHAEALANLAQLWKEVGNADRALESEQVLAERYPSSKWNKK